MSQVKIEKLQTGGVTPAPSAPAKKAESLLKFIVDDTLYEASENALRNEYSNFIKTSGGRTKNVNDWDKDMETVLSQIKNGQASGNFYNFNTAGDRATKITYGGDDLSNTQRGLKDNGKVAKGGLFSSVTGETNSAARIASINSMFGSVLAKGTRNQNEANAKTEKEAADKLKNEQDAKRKLDTDRALNDFRFSNFFGKSLDGKPMSSKQLYQTYHKNEAAQAGYHKDFLERMKHAVTNPIFQTEEGKKAFASAFPGMDFDTFSKNINNINTAGKINYEGVYKKLGLYNDYAELSDRTAWDSELHAKKLQKLIEEREMNTALNGGDDTKESPEETEKIPAKFSLGSGTNFKNYLHAKVNINGVETTLGNYLKDFDAKDKKGELTQDEMDFYKANIEPKMMEFRSQYQNPDGAAQNPYNFNGYRDITDESLWNLDGEFRQNPYQLFGRRYQDVKSIQDVLSYKDITGDFTGLADVYKGGVAGEGYRDFALIEEILKGRDGEPVNRSRYRYISNSGFDNHVDIRPNSDGTYELISFTDATRKTIRSKRNIGRPNLSRNPNEKRNPFKYTTNKTAVKTRLGPEVKKEGGTLKFQYGGFFGEKSGSNDPLLNLQGQASDKNRKVQTLGVIDQVTGNLEASNAEKLELGALIADMAGLGMSFAPGLGVGTGIAGLASSGAHAAARSSRGETWKDWGGELALNAALDVGTAVPILGGAAKTYKVARTIKKLMGNSWFRNSLALAVGAAGAAQVTTAGQALLDGDFSAENLRVFTGGITALTAGKRVMHDRSSGPLGAYKDTKTGNIKATVDGKNYNFKLGQTHLNELDSKTLTQQKEYITNIVKKKIPGGKDYSLDVNKRDPIKVFGKTLRSGKETGLNLDVETASVLRDPKNSNFFQKRAIARQEAMMTKPKQKVEPETPVTETPEVKREPLLIENTGKARSRVYVDDPYVEVDGRNIKTKNTSAADPVRKYTVEDLRETLRNNNLAKGRQSGPKVKAEARKQAAREARGEYYKPKATNVPRPPATNVPVPPGGLRTKTAKQAEEVIKQTKGTKRNVENIAKNTKAVKTNSVFSDKELKQIRKSLNLSSSKEQAISVKDIIEPTTKAQRQLSNRLVNLAKNDKKIAKYLDDAVLNYNNKDRTAKLKLATGGVVKAQYGLKIPKIGVDVPSPYYLNQPNPTVTVPNTSLNNSTAFKPFSTTTKTPSVAIPKLSANTAQGIADVRQNLLNTEAVRLENERIAGGGNQVLPKNPSFKYNPLQISEFGRALANRRAHGRLDTRSEAAILDAPVQVSPTVKGDVLGQQAYLNSAATLEQSMNRPTTSDAGVNLAGRLAAGAKGAQLRTQGGIANATAIRQQEAQKLQSDQQYSGVRSEVANRNRTSIANKIQSERIANNTRDAAMFKSLDNFWAATNREKYMDNARMQSYQDVRNQLLAQQQKFGEGSAFAGKTPSEAGAAVSTEIERLTNLLATTTDPTEKANIQDQLTTQRRLGSQLDLERSLLITNPKLFSEKYGQKTVTLPTLYRGEAKEVQTRANGGKLTLEEKSYLEQEKAKNKMLNEWYKGYEKFIKTQAEIAAKESMAGQKAAVEFSKQALKGK